jgi:hypothetical protein
METTVYPCDYEIPANGSVDGYPNVKASRCTFCDEMCDRPDVDSSIGFFDGFDKKKVGITYAVLLSFTVLW